MSKLVFLHFDTSQRDNPNADPFNSSFTLTNPIKNVKKIYLKSAEIPSAFFNLRTTHYFIFDFSNKDNLNGAGIPTLNLKFTPENISNYYFNITNSIALNPNPVTPVAGTTVKSPIRITINVVSGNYTIYTLIAYLNAALAELWSLYGIQYDLGPITPSITTTMTTDQGASFPVGYARFNFAPNYYVRVNAATSVTINNAASILGFAFQQPNLYSPYDPYVDAQYLWNIYTDTCLYLHFPNIPHTNTHFKTQLVSFKIPITSGYQAIEFAQENLNFAQYIEVSDSTFIFNKLSLQIYDRKNLPISNNNFDWTFTLGIQYDD